MKKPHVLIIEDDEWLAASYARCLNAADYRTATTTSAVSAIDVIDNDTPQIILLDVLLNTITGFALLHELQSHVDLARIPIVLITNLADEIQLHSLDAYGVRQVLDKAVVTPRALVSAVRSVL